MNSTGIFFAAFLASAVEMVEAATIVLAMEVSRGARAAYSGAIAALLLLFAVTAAFAPLLLAVPLQPLRLVVGSLILVFGLDWLRKAILRASGHKALHDEAAIFASEVQKLSGESTPTARIDRIGFVVAFKGVLLEGLEVVVIVLTLGGAQHNVGVAALGAVFALLVVGCIAGALRKPLVRVPENAMKLVVGVMLVSFGTFWSSEGAGVHWPGDDAALIALVGWYATLSATAITMLRRKPVVVA